MRLILIGQALNREAGEAMAALKPELRERYAKRISLTGEVGKRIANLVGISFFVYLRHTDRRNLIDRFPGKSGKGDAFPIEEAYRNAMYMRNDLHGRSVIFIGRQVAAAFGCARFKILRWWDGSGTGLPCRRFAILPHPSRLNRWWSDSRHERAAEKFLRDAFKEWA